MKQCFQNDLIITHTPQEIILCVEIIYFYTHTVTNNIFITLFILTNKMLLLLISLMLIRKQFFNFWTTFIYSCDFSCQHEKFSKKIKKTTNPSLSSLEKYAYMKICYINTLVCVCVCIYISLKLICLINPICARFLLYL